MIRSSSTPLVRSVVSSPKLAPRPPLIPNPRPVDRVAQPAVEAAVHVAPHASAYGPPLIDDSLLIRFLSAWCKGRLSRRHDTKKRSSHSPTSAGPSSRPIGTKTSATAGASPSARIRPLFFERQRTMASLKRMRLCGLVVVGNMSFTVFHCLFHFSTLIETPP